MRIDDNNLSGINSPAAGGNQKVRQANQESSAAAKPGKVGASQDEVLLSSIADRVSGGSLSNELSVSAERSAKIEQLTKLVQSGNYHPNPEKVADSMIQDMLSGPGSS
jgi:flagellar biosynthesis anti-sigma factor FlgM